jgi:hypothetical protein
MKGSVPPHPPRGGTPHSATRQEAEQSRPAGPQVRRHSADQPIIVEDKGKRYEAIYVEGLGPILIEI